jgi:hypothetical protein
VHCLALAPIAPQEMGGIKMLLNSYLKHANRPPT